MSEAKGRRALTKDTSWDDMIGADLTLWMSSSRCKRRGVMRLRATELRGSREIDGRCDTEGESSSPAEMDERDERDDSGADAAPRTLSTFSGEAVCFHFVM